MTEESIKALPSLATTVLYDPDVPASITVSSALDADLWAKEDGPPPRSYRTVAVIETPAQAQEMLGWIRAGIHRPALVVAWNLPEEAALALLQERVPVLDGWVVEHPQDAAEAVLGLWTSERFFREMELTRSLARLEMEMGLA